MPLLADRVRETTTTVGTGTITLAGAVTGFQSFNTAFLNGDTVYYVIQGGTEWEIGIGTVGTGTLARTTVLQSSNSDALVPFSAGIKDVFVAYVADRAVTTSDAATLTNKTIDDYTNNVGANSTHFRIKASGNIAKGTVVKAIGFTPGQAAIEVAAVSSVSDIALGLAEQTLTSGQFGTAIVIGELFDVNTNGLSVGAILYSNGTGGYTTTKPSSGLYQPLGWVVRANTNNGVIAVNIVAPLTVEASTNTANTLVLRDGSGNFAAGTITANLTGNVSGSAGSVAAANITGTTLASNVTGSSLTSVGTLANLTVSGNLTVDTNTLFVDAVNNRVGVGTASPATALHVYSPTATTLRVDNNDNAAAQTIALATGGVNRATFSIATSTSDLVIKSEDAGGRSNGIQFWTGNASAERLRIDSSGNVGIGTNNPASFGNVALVYGGDSVYRFMQSGNTGSNSVTLSLGSNTRNDSAAYLIATQGGGTNVYNLNIGVGQAGFSSGFLSFSVGGSERWRISTAGNLLASTDALFDIGASGANRPRNVFVSTAVTTPSVTNAGTLALSATGANSITMSTNGNERFRVNATGGISANQASTALSGWPTGSSHLFRVNAPANAGITLGDPTGVSNSSVAVNLTSWVGGGSNYYTSQIRQTGGGSLIFATQATSSTDGSGALTDCMTLDRFGNLGLGVTPSAWESTCRMLQLGAVATVGRANSGETQLGFNYFVNSTGQYTYIQSLTALRYEQVNGQHRWFTAPSGTAGNAITFTQAMTLNASGNLGIGTTTPDAGLHVNRTVTGAGLSTPIAIFSGGAFNSGTSYGIGFHFSDVGSAVCPVGIGYTITSSAGDTLGALSFFTRNTTTLGDVPTERVRVKAEGQVRFVPLAAAPTTNVEDGDVYYDSGTNKLRVRAGGAWVDLH